MLLTRTVVVLGLVLASTSCKIHISTSPDGKVESNSGAYTCAAGDNCEIDVSDAFFDEKFRAIPDQGFKFTAWRTKARSFCGGQNQPCRLTTTGFPGTPLMNLLETEDVFYLEPVFGRPNTWAPGVELPVASVGLSSCVVRGKLYAFSLAHHGNAADVDRRVEEFDPTTQSWTRKADAPTPRAWATATAVKNKCYLIGGFGAVLGDTGLAAGGIAVEEYDPATDNWRARAPLPEGRQALASAVVNGKIYVLGGATPGGGWFRPAIPSVAIYDPVTNTWSKGADMPQPRGGLVAGAIGGYIYTVGGCNTDLKNSELVHRYDPVNDEWIARAPIPVKTANATASVHNGALYVMGGFDPTKVNGFGTDPATTTVYRYDPDANQWSQRASMNTARQSGTSESIDGQIYALGGRSDRSVTPLADMEVYTPVD